MSYNCVFHKYIIDNVGIITNFVLSCLCSFLLHWDIMMLVNMKIRCQWV